MASDVPPGNREEAFTGHQVVCANGHGGSLIHRNWRKPEEYDFCDALTREQWAWEFLRRNPEYQRQWRAFHETWQALEAAYGRPPNRDFCAWKNDPRAWVPASECEGGDCRIDGDKVLIECALGARWGFHKFPPDPEDDDPVGEGRLSWRPLDEEPLPEVEGEWQPGPERMALVFDLSLPLKPQLEQARKQLQMEMGVRRRRGELVPQRVSRWGEHWKRLLRCIDADVEGSAKEFLELESPVSGNSLYREAHEMMKKGYLKILRMPP